MHAQGLAEGFYQGLSEIQAAILLLQDSSTFTLSKYSSKHADFGRTSAGQKGRGFHLHPTLAVDAEQEDLYGLAHLHWWTRSTRQPSQKEDPIEQKESYRWLASPLRARQPRTASWPLPRESGYSTGSASNPCRGKSICFCRPSLGSDRLARTSCNYALVD